MKIKKITMVLLVNLIVILVLCIALEVLARFFLPEFQPTRQERSDFWVYHPQFGWFHKANSEGQFKHPSFNISVSHNSQGFREFEIGSKRGKRLVVLGDSYTWGFGVGQSSRYTDLLDAGMPDWEVLNAGVSGFGTDQELLLLSNKVFDLQPDFILLQFHPNDFETNLLNQAYGYNKPRFEISDGQLVLEQQQVAPSTIMQRFERFLNHDTYVLGLIWQLLKSQTYDRLFAEQNDYYNGMIFSAYQQSYPVSFRLLERIQQLCQQRSIGFAVVSTPMKKPHARALGAAMNKAGIPYLNLNSAFAAQKDFTIKNDEHWNEKGHRIAAGALLVFLQELMLPVNEER